MEALRLWLRALFLRRRVEDEMRREMRHHLDMEVAVRVRDGMSEDEARRTALLTFGGVVNAEESVRDERRTRVLEIIASDVRYALRGFARQPGYALVVVALLAMGIGGNTALFSVLYHELIAPLPFADGGRMVRLHATSGKGTFQLQVNESLADAWRGMSRAVEQVTIVGSGDFTLGDSTSATPRQVHADILSPGASRLISMSPEIGRDITPVDTLLGATPVVLISHGMWRADYGGARSVLGTPLMIDGLRHTIIGVVPSGYQMPFLEDADVFIARRAQPASAPMAGPPPPPMPDAPGSGLRDAEIQAVGKTRPGVTVEGANREMAVIFSRWIHSPDGESFAGSLIVGESVDTPTLMRAVDEVHPWLREMVLVLFGAMSLVLLIACANVANLMLGRAWSRQRELAVRAAMGASGWRLTAQTFIESCLLAVAGALGGVGIAELVLRAILHSQLGKDVAGARLEPAVLAWCAFLALCTALLFGVAPARFAAESRMTDALKAGARSASGSAGARRFRAALVGFEITLSVTLLAGAGLLVRTLVAMDRADIGLDTHSLVSFPVFFPRTRLTPPARAAAVSAIQAGLGGLPGVESVSTATMGVPMFGLAVGGLTFENTPANPADSVVAIGFNAANPDYFARVGLRVTSGRVFQPDLQVTNVPDHSEVMVNERFQRRFWPGGSALGKRFDFGTWGWSTIVGVVHDVDIPGVDDPRRSLQVYTPMPAAPYQLTFVVRSTIPPARLDSLFRGIAQSAAPAIRRIGMHVADDALSSGRSTQRSMLILLGAFAVVALLLAAIGLHAVIAFSVSQRTREIGMRMALGAESHDVIRLVLGQGLGIAVIGVGCGLAVALGATRALRSYLYGVGASDPTTLLLVAVSLLAVAAIATLAPALRAARLDPVEALRAD